MGNIRDLPPVGKCSPKPHSPNVRKQHIRAVPEDGSQAKIRGGAVFHRASADTSGRRCRLKCPEICGGDARHEAIFSRPSGEAMQRFFVIVAGFVIGAPILLAMILLFYPRPEDHTPARIFEGDAHAIDYCDLPVLDGSGLMAGDFPQGHTPNCGYEKFPMPVLAGCNSMPWVYFMWYRDTWRTETTSGIIHGSVPPPCKVFANCLMASE